MLPMINKDNNLIVFNEFQLFHFDYKQYYNKINKVYYMIPHHTTNLLFSKNQLLFVFTYFYI